MTDLVYAINRDYSQDVKNINEWYAHDVAQSKLEKNFYVIVNARVLQEIQDSIGLQEDMQFMEDIYDRMDMTVDYISLVRISPWAITGPSIIKIRDRAFDPSTDQIFDHRLQNRNCVMVVPLQGFDDSVNIRWISKRLALTDRDLLTKNFSGNIAAVTKMGQQPFLMRSDQAIQYANLENPNYFYFLQIGFERNPAYEEVKYKFHKLTNQ
jgi:hypothetical protein